MRLTIPEGKIALIISPQLADELMTVAKIIRGPRRYRAKALDDAYNVAGDLMLAIVEGQS